MGRRPSVDPGNPAVSDGREWLRTRRVANLVVHGGAAFYRAMQKLAVCDSGKRF
jgi:hypothetical protein